MKIVVDASVAAKWFLPEPDAAIARTFLDPGHDLRAPELLLVECVNVLWVKQRRGIITALETDLAIDALERGTITFVPVHLLVRRAFEIAREIGHPIYDCSYIALAEREGCVVVTADRRLLARTRGTAYEHRVKDLAASGG